ncbi:DedA family protein [Demequina sp. NBRC 110053]|uniref:DedA family protein n=1 Tax=Demequina sp. NBRC 110053 TaxID=1570342 RepID=UPI000A01079A|nr:VTT domain-containing protein [Demequina sp. NBRC 110053]
MPGVPAFIFDGPWWGLFAFLFCVVLLRTQATYWLARWARTGADAVADRAEDRDSRRAGFARRLSGPGMERARAFIERRGFLAIPLSFFTVGFQTMVNAAAGYARMRFDLYTLAMIPGCLAWATIYTAIALSLWEVWLRSPWLLAAAVLVLAAAVVGLNLWRRRAVPAAPADPTSPYAS